jgi:hypothetical protein
MRQPRPEISVTRTDRDSYRSCPGKVCPGPGFLGKDRAGGRDLGLGLGVDRGAEGLVAMDRANRVTLV